MALNVGDVDLTELVVWVVEGKGRAVVAGVWGERLCVPEVRANTAVNPDVIVHQPCPRDGKHRVVSASAPA